MRHCGNIIRKHINDWSTRLGNLNWWPKYVYHFTDIHNAVSILESGYLYSRNLARANNLMQADNASNDVIQHTNPEHLNFVRLYFRPKTPTQYRNEGIRPLDGRDLGAHCGVPIFLCFDSYETLNLDESEVSNGNMGSHRANHSSQPEFFSQIPFHLVYHSGAIPDGDKDEIVFRRNAEILIPDKLAITNLLRLICCRSAAERQTLLTMLSDATREKWFEKIRIGDYSLYFRKWTFVEEVVTVEDRIIFRFNPNSTTPGPFNIKFSYTEDGEERIRSWNGKRESLVNNLGLVVPNATVGIASLKLDDTIAYLGRVYFTEIPF